MRKAIVFLCVLGLLTLAGPAWGIDYVWDNDSGDGFWETVANWNPDGDPSWGDTATVGDGLIAVVNGSYSSLSGPVYVGNAGGTGTIVIPTYPKGLYSPLYIGHGGGDGVVMLAGGLSSGDCRIGGTGDGTENGTLNFVAGWKNVAKTLIVMDEGDNAGNLATWDIQCLPAAGGIIMLSGVSGQSSAAYAQIGLQFGGSATASNNNVLYKAVEGTVINFTGCTHSWDDYYEDVPEGGNIWHFRNPSFVNQCTDDTATGLGDLNNTTFVYKGFADTDNKRRTTSGCGEFEAGGRNLGVVMAGLTDNFALEGLTLETGAGGGAEIRLVDNFDNGNRSSAEAVYVENLVLENDTILHTNGINLYYLTANIDPGAVINTVGGGGVSAICEPPSPAPGVLAVSVKADAGIGYDGTVELSSQTAANYGQLPVTAYVRHIPGATVLVKGQARSYYDADGLHNTVGAIAYGLDHDSDLSADGTLTISKTILISSSETGLAAGTQVWANGTLRLNGLLRLLRDEGEGWPDAENLAAIFSALVIKTGSGGEVICFAGSVSLLGDSGESWADVVLAGDADTLVLQQACDGLVVGDDLAYLFLDHVGVGFSVPAVVGQEFYVDIIFRAEAFVPMWAEGLRADVAFGDQLAPEPSTMVLLLTGLTLLRRRRQESPVA